MSKVSRMRLVALLVIVVLFAPISANAGVGDIITLLRTITSTLQNTVGQTLGQIQAINTKVRDLQQQVVWPLNLINQTKAFIGQTRAQLTSVAVQIHSIGTNSATLANPSQLEFVVRNRQTSDLNQIAGAYTRVYQPLPKATEAMEADRSLMDMDDAMSQGALKTTIASDNASEQILAAANGIEKETMSSAPGAALMLTAEAQAVNLKNQAFLHKLFAAELRQEAARLAHTNAVRKRSAEGAGSLRNHMQQILNSR
jgi:hypothetical protein